MNKVDMEPVAWADDAAVQGRVGNVCSTAAKRYWEKSNWVDKKNAELHKHPLHTATQLQAAVAAEREKWALYESLVAEYGLSIFPDLEKMQAALRQAREALDSVAGKGKLCNAAIAAIDKVVKP